MAAAITRLLLNLVEIYSYIMLFWVIGSWFPRLTITKIYQFVDKLVYPYARIFRGFIPPIGGFDFSVILAFLVLQLLLPPIIIKIGSLVSAVGA
jgi:YggT family protein